MNSCPLGAHTVTVDPKVLRQVTPEVRRLRARPFRDAWRTAEWLLVGMGLLGPGAGARGDSWQVELVAGGTHHDGAAANAAFSDIFGMAWDSRGGLVVADAGNHAIRRISQNGQVTTLAGAGALGWRDGPGTLARFRSPSGVAVDRDGAVWVADSDNHCLRRIGPDGTVSTVAGKALDSGLVDGLGAVARFNTPGDLAIAEDGRILIADTWNAAIRQLDTNGVVRTVVQGARQFPAGYAVGQARWYLPESLAFGPNRLWLVGESGNFGRVSAGSNAAGFEAIWETGQFGLELNWVGGLGVAWDRTGQALMALNLLVTRDRFMPPTNFDGLFKIGEAGSLIPLAGQLPSKGDVASNRLATGPDGNIYVARGELIVRVTERGEVSVLAGREADPVAEGRGSAAKLRSVRGLARLRDGSLVLSEEDTHRLWRISAGGEVTWWSGKAGGGFADGAADTACFQRPHGLAVAPNGDVLVADFGNGRIRRVRPDGSVSTVAGSGNEPPPAGHPRNDYLDHPERVAVDSTGNIYVVEWQPAIRVIQPDGTITNRWGSTFTGTAGNGPPTGLWVDREDRVWASTKGRVLELRRDGSAVVRHDFADYVRQSWVEERPVVRSFCVDHGGHAWMASDHGYEVVRLSPRGVRLKITCDMPGEAAAYPPEGRGIVDPLLMVPDPSGGIVFWDEQVSALKRLSPKADSPAGVAVFPELPKVAPGRPLKLSALTTDASAPAAFQWRRNGELLVDQDGSDLILDPFAADLAGDYSVLVSREGELVASAPVTIGVMAPPRIVKEPGSSVTAGGWPTDLVVIAEGEGELRYQWFHDDQEARLATLPVYYPTPFPARLETCYRVRVENDAGSVMSRTVTHSTWRIEPAGNVELVSPVGTPFRLESAESPGGPWVLEREFTQDTLTNRWSLPTDGPSPTKFFRLVPGE